MNCGRWPAGSVEHGSRRKRRTIAHSHCACLPSVNCITFPNYRPQPTMGRAEFAHFCVSPTIERRAVRRPPDQIQPNCLKPGENQCKAPHLMANSIFANFYQPKSLCARYHFVSESVTLRRPFRPVQQSPATAKGLQPAGSQALTTFDPLPPKLLYRGNLAIFVPFARLIMPEQPSL